ncbi:MAG: helix-turn-helix domain-containing protein [Rhodobacter sp.]|jgi:AraC family transcriptional activator of pobA|nr:helix-turn-helix domain-containing protein [Rhodobacter sp.]MCA3458275.1 helix-turn-helix domain-containing protein [Rhodobacter sp.]MCA3460950.1 helix-turn-helix domain-containing protein [Rhodobacter sp.]MCA3463973.1 helix-turn-helix domain-containing protein [Rhodobacter sp.]MCA3466786.1 helix-turn-helix domain-containing protein [Rhodobacter sp.]
MNDLSPGPQARLIAIPRLAAGGRWRVEAMRSLSEPMLLWFTKGQGRITVAGVTRGYTPHNAIFIPAGMMHGFEIGPQVFGTAVFFGRDGDVALPVTPLHLRIRDSQSQVELNLCLDSVQRELDSPEPGHDRAVRHHLGLLGVWLERQAARMPPDTVAPVSARRLVMGFTALLERDFRSGRGVADYAAAMGVTPTHLTRCCQRTCGRPASALLHDRLLFEARRMLTETDRPVSHIARDLGFTSPSYFTRAFLHQTGKTPSAFRRAP